MTSSDNTDMLREFEALLSKLRARIRRIPPRYHFRAQMLADVTRHAATMRRALKRPNTLTPDDIIAAEEAGEEFFAIARIVSAG